MRSFRAFITLLALFALALPLTLVAQSAPAGYPGLETGKMWTFDAPPLEYWARRYNFQPAAGWIDHVRMSALRLPGCTASFVSSDGLVMSNHHCARSCVVAASRPGEDLLTTGFYAARREDERACGAGTYVDQLLGITDVTDSVTAAVGSATGSQGADLRTAAQRRLEAACRGGAADIVCQLVPMYRGGQYKLYRFRRYSDLRLVMVPEDSIAFFGGDPDNFVYPRHDLDMSFMRVYINGQPAHPEHFYRWSRNGTNEGDLVFVVGNPGATNRLNAIGYLEFLRDTGLPATLAQYRRQLAAYEDIGRVSPDHGAAYRNNVFGIANDQKRTIVYREALLDSAIMNQKRAWEQQLRSRVNADAALKRRIGDPWSEVAAVRRQMAPLDARRRFYAFSAYGTRLLNLAALIVRLPIESAKPDSARLMAYRDANRAALERTLYDATPIDTIFETRMLAAYLTAMSEELPANDPVRRAALGGRTPDEAARQMVQGARILTPDQRRAALQAGVGAPPEDPFIRLAMTIDPLQRDIDRQWTDLVNREVPADERIARAVLAVFGNSVAPDANFTLRISDGVVASYPYNGSIAQPYTTFFGLYDRNLGFGGRAPFNLPARWLARRDSLNLATPYNAVSTNDLIGGNSGSPVVNRDGEVVGLIFDGNMESLPWRFLFSESRGRSVWVDSRGILEALRGIYGARALADEMAGGR